MSLFSGFVDSLFGAGTSDNVISGINNYTGINLDFGLSSTTPNVTTPTTPTTDTDSSWFSPSNIIGGLGVYSQITGAQDKAKAVQDQLQAELAGKKELSAQDFEQAKQLALLKASLGGGGGGGGGSSQAEALAYDAKKTRYLGIQDAMKARQEAQGQSSSGIIQAIKNLTEAAQRPLSR